MDDPFRTCLVHVSPVYFLCICCRENAHMSRSCSSNCCSRINSIEILLLECASLVFLTSVIPLPSCLQTFPTSGSFPMSRFFPSGGQVLELYLQRRYTSEYSGLISYRTDWFDLLAVQGTLKSLLQHHSFQKQQFFSCSGFCMVQGSQPYKRIIRSEWVTIMYSNQPFINTVDILTCSFTLTF